MTTLTHKNKIAALLCGISFLNLSLFALAGEMKTADGKQNRIEIKDFAFNPQTLTVKSGDKINRPRSIPIKSSRSQRALPALTPIFAQFIRR